MTDLATRGMPAAPKASLEARAQEMRRHYFTGAPGRMRILGALAALACLAFAVTGILSLRAVDGSVDLASANTEQVVRAQAIYVDLLKADATASNGFLVGGLESAEQRETYDTAMTNVARNIAEAARAQRADGVALAALNERVQRYAANIDQARVYNRQGLPVGAQYLRIASSELRSQALPIVAAVAEANQVRAADELRGAGRGAPVVWVGLVTVALLATIAYWLARRTHRLLNLPLTAALALVVIALVAAFNSVRATDDVMTKVAEGPYRSAVAVASARAAAYDAKANESLTLIARGSGAAFEKAYASSVGKARAELNQARDLRALFDAYTSRHAEIRAADDDGDWDRAVELATATGDDSANAAFTRFDDGATTQLSDAVGDTVASLGNIGNALLGWLVALAGLTAAALSLRAMSKRIEEYR